MSEPKVMESAETLTAGATPDSATPVPFEAPQPKLGNRYELLGLLGVGGMGAVYRVLDVELGEIVALKMLRPESVGDAEALARFRQEVRLARRVTHKNVARTFDIGQHEGEKFLTMELVDGGSLAGRIERGALSGRETIDIAEAICAGLSAAHAAGVVHRDLKPENVLIAKDGRVVVTDFGIAHAGETGQSAIVGTPAYMAPEQLDPRTPVDHRADIYALGAVIYEMLTGERAWKGDAPMVVLGARVLSTSPPDPRDTGRPVSAALSDVVMRCMAKEPSARFDSADDVARALRGALDSAGTSLRPANDAGLASLRASSSGKTVAVLPIRNDGAESDDFLSEGLTDDLIDSLSMTRGLLVRPRGVVSRFKNVDRDATEIGRELAVQVVVEGSLRRTEGQIRFGLRVIGVEDGFQLWARRFDARFQDLLVVSNGAARAIALALTTELPDVGVGPTDPVAIELYMRAKQEYWRSWSKDVSAAIDLFERALALAPSDPKIIAGTALAHARSVFFGDGGHREAAIARCRELSERAVVVAPELGDAWASLASFRMHTGDPVAAARALRAGLAHAPNSALLQDITGRLLLEVGAIDEALARLDLATSLDSSLFTSQLELARGRALLGDFAGADSTLEKLTDWSRAGVARPAQQSRLALWQRKRDANFGRSPEDTYSRVYEELMPTGVLTDAHREFMRMRPERTAGRLRALHLQRNTELFAYVGETDAAIESLERAVAADLIDVVWIDRCPLFDALRTDPRWKASRAVVHERATRILDAFRSDAA
jgi:serine/threonine protein kinase/tetratricopeptide (TPR) repeat protein